MNIMKAGYKRIDIENPTKKIEKIARVCYKSEDKIEEGTDLLMIQNLINRQHTAMLEHASIVIQLSEFISHGIDRMIDDINSHILHVSSKDYDKSKGSDYLRYTKDTHIISGNIRAWYNFYSYVKPYTEFIRQKSIEDIYTNRYVAIQKILSVLKNHCAIIFDDFDDKIEDPCYSLFENPIILSDNDFMALSDYDRLVHEDMSILFTVDRGVTHELVRHRPVSFAQESTRYCNYSLGKFGEEISVIEPCFFEKDSFEYNTWKSACEEAEKMYFQLIHNGAKPQEARSVLPTSTKAEIVLTANLMEWRHIFKLRACDATGPAHPQMKEVMVPLLQELQKTERYKSIFGDLTPAI